MKKTLIALAMLALGSTAFAQVYVNAAVGASSINVPAEEGLSLDKTGTGFKANLGYKFTPYFGVEGG